MFCPNCGKELQEDAAFCGHCGARVRPSEKVRDADKNPVRRDAGGRNSGSCMGRNEKTSGYYREPSADGDRAERAKTVVRKGTGRKKGRFVVMVVIIAIVLVLLILAIAMGLADRSSAQSGKSAGTDAARKNVSDESAAADGAVGAAGEEEDHSATEETEAESGEAGTVSLFNEEKDVLKEVLVYRIDEDTGEELLTQRTRYDEEERVTEVFSDTSVYMEEGWGINDIHYQYDENGNVTLITKEGSGHSSAADEVYDYQYESSYSNEYDSEDRLKRVIVEVVQTENNLESYDYTVERAFEYNEDGALQIISAEMEGQGYTAQLVYDEEGLVAALELTGSELYDIRFDFTYDEEGHLISCVLGSGDENSVTSVGLVMNALEWGLYDDSIESSWQCATYLLSLGYARLEHRYAEDGTLMWTLVGKQDGTQFCQYLDARFIARFIEEYSEEVESMDWELYADESGRVTSVIMDDTVCYYEYYAD